ncbi:MAG: FMN-binding negative transcriptional regulator [Glaciimonas sp.]|nr:FMN-binding negative transcriptional regulator [Glaciimonas sp.]
MYVPSHFAEDRLDVLHQLIHDYPLGTLVTLESGGLNANHIPFEIAPASAAAPHGTLRAHIARNNLLWRNASDAVEALVVFQGPQAYITPAWYEEKKVSGRVVPTYNYATVHAYGPLRVIDDAAWLHALLERLTHRHEAARPQPWQVSDAPPEFIEKTVPAIIGIEIPLSRVIGSWKASQNRSSVDRRTIADGLREIGDASAMAMADLVAR